MWEGIGSRTRSLYVESGFRLKIGFLLLHYSSPGLLGLAGWSAVGRVWVVTIFIQPLSSLKLQLIFSSFDLRTCVFFNLTSAVWPRIIQLHLPRAVFSDAEETSKGSVDMGCISIVIAMDANNHTNLIFNVYVETFSKKTF